MESWKFLRTPGEGAQFYLRTPNIDSLIVEELHPRIGSLPTSRQPRRQRPDMCLELVPVRVEKIERRTFAAVIPPFPHVGGSQALDERQEVHSFEAEGVMGVVGGRRGL